jgi:hypothetical protein
MLQKIKLGLSRFFENKQMNLAETGADVQKLCSSSSLTAGQNKLECFVSGKSFKLGQSKLK